MPQASSQPSDHETPAHVQKNSAFIAGSSTAPVLRDLRGRRDTVDSDRPQLLEPLSAASRNQADP